MQVAIGGRLPETSFQVVAEDGVGIVSTEQLFRNSRVVLFGLPGAFTPVCHKQHLPDIIEAVDGFKAAGVDRVAITSTNDAYVLDAWASLAGSAGQIEVLGDCNAAFAKAAGLAFDATDRGMGLRSKRYAMVVDDGVVTHLRVEDSPLDLNAASPKNMLADLMPPLRRAA